MLRRMVRSRVAWTLAGVLVVLAGAGLYWFQPWKLATDRVVEERLPSVVDSPAPGGAPAQPGTPGGAPAQPGTPGSGSPAPADGSPAGNRVVAAGTFVTHEHPTTGTAQIVRLADGRHQLVLRELNTSNGPDLRVWLTDRPVVGGRAGWHVFDDGRWVELARLKGNRGGQVYDIPSGVDPADFRSVSIWCRRFAVSFGAAELAAR